MSRETEHVLKTVARYWDAVKSGEKTFEVRRNDRAFQTGDTLLLRRTDEFGQSSPLPEDQGEGESILRKRVTYILQGGQFGIEPGVCVLGLGSLNRIEGVKE